MNFDGIVETTFTPAQTANMGVQRIKRMEANQYRAMPLPLPEIQDYVAALMPGDTCAVLAQTSNYKSGFMSWWARELAAHLAENNRADESIIVVDTENVIETIGIQEIAYQSDHSVADLSRGNVRDWSSIYLAAGKVGEIDIFRVATSLGRDDAPDLYLSNIYRGIKAMTSGEVVDRTIKPAAIFIDYLQALPIDPEVKAGTRYDNQRRLQVREDVYRIRRMAAYFKCPIIVGVQAKQHLAGNPGPNFLIPGMYDGEETSSIAQRFDRILSFWMPKTTHTHGDTVIHRGMEFQVSDDLLYFKVLKQRGGLPAGKTWPLSVDHTRNRIRPYNARPAMGVRPKAVNL